MLKGFYSVLIAIGNALQPVFLLAVRLFWGWQFFSGGKDKLADISPVVELFQSLDVPLPTATAYLVGSVECFGGLCLLIGLAARLAAIPLIATMTMAIILAHPMSIAEITEDPLKLVQQLPFTFWLASVTIFVFGPGGISLDALFKRFLSRA